MASRHTLRSLVNNGATIIDDTLAADRTGDFNTAGWNQVTFYVELVVHADDAAGMSLNLQLASNHERDTTNFYSEVEEEVATNVVTLDVVDKRQYSIDFQSTAGTYRFKFHVPVQAERDHRLTADVTSGSASSTIKVWAEASGQ